MIVVDSSAIIAILFDEPESLSCSEALGAGHPRLLSAVNYVETGTVLAGRFRQNSRQGAVNDLDNFRTTSLIDIIPLDIPLAQTALQAYLI